MKITAEVYDIPEVKAACERAQKRKEVTDNDSAVYVDSTCLTRTWLVDSEEMLHPPAVCVFTTYEGRLIE